MKSSARYLIVAFLSLVAAVAPAQIGQQMSCEQAQSFTRSVKGFRIRVVPNDNEFGGCKVLLDLEAGPVVVTADQAVTLLPVSGEDVNRDGVPDLVVEGFSGGAHCCSTYTIFSLSAKPKLVFKID